MAHQLKKISDQVIVITGASSGIGLSTAMLASEKGARLVLSSANENDLRDLVSRVRQRGGEAVFVEADVASIDEVDRIAKRALSEFGRIDSWICASGISLDGKLTEVHMEQKRKLFENNYWGTVYCCRAAVKAMGQNGGSIINIIENAEPNSGVQSVVDAAVTVYSESLNLELKSENIPISISEADSQIGAEMILKRCESPDAIRVALKSKLVTDLISRIEGVDRKKSIVVAAGLGVAAFAAFKAIQNSRKPGEATH